MKQESRTCIYKVGSYMDVLKQIFSNTTLKLFISVCTSQNYVTSISIQWNLYGLREEQNS